MVSGNATILSPQSYSVVGIVLLVIQRKYNLKILEATAWLTQLAGGFVLRLELHDKFEAVALYKEALDH